MRCWKWKRIRMLQCLQSQTHAHPHIHSQWNTPLYCTLFDTRMQRPLFHSLCMKNTAGGNHWGLYVELRAFFFLLLDTPSHMSCCQPYRSRLSYRLIKAERWSYLIQNYMALQHAWSLQLSPLPFQNEKHSRGIAKVWCFSRSGCSDSHCFSKARFDLHSFCFFCRVFFFHLSLLGYVSNDSLCSQAVYCVQLIHGSF